MVRESTRVATFTPAIAEIEAYIALNVWWQLVLVACTVLSIFWFPY